MVEIQPIKLILQVMRSNFGVEGSLSFTGLVGRLRVHLA